VIERRFEFADTEALAAALAAHVAAELDRAIEARGHAALAVSGGTTPIRFFKALSQRKLSWGRVAITLVDERQVPPTSERSNARLVRDHLLKHEAARARFEPLLGNPRAADVPPFDVVVLGLGADGHTASFFPKSPQLGKVLDADATEKIMAVTAPGAEEARLTFTLPWLLRAALLCLHCEGAAKKAVLKEALGAGPVADMPIRAVLRAATPVSLYWCP
jgi:6-phosphogluconolactonase